MTYEHHLKESAERHARIQERRSMFTYQDMERIAAQSWNATKPESDPPFYHADHVMDHRNMLTSVVKDIIQTGKSDNPRLQAFEERVLAIVDELKNPKVPAGEMSFEDQQKATAEGAKADFVEGEIVEDAIPPLETAADHRVSQRRAATLPIDHPERRSHDRRATIVEPTGNS